MQGIMWKTKQEILDKIRQRSRWEHSFALSSLRKASTKKQERTFLVHSCFMFFVFTCKAFSFANDKLFHPLYDPGSRSDFWRRWCESALHNFLLHVTNLINNTNICLFELSLLYTHKLPMQGLYTLYFLRTNNDGSIDAGARWTPCVDAVRCLSWSKKRLYFSANSDTILA